MSKEYSRTEYNADVRTHMMATQGRTMVAVTEDALFYSPSDSKTAYRINEVTDAYVRILRNALGKIPGDHATGDDEMIRIDRKKIGKASRTNIARLVGIVDRAIEIALDPKNALARY